MNLVINVHSMIKGAGRPVRVNRYKPFVL